MAPKRYMGQKVRKYCTRDTFYAVNCTASYNCDAQLSLCVDEPWVALGVRRQCWASGAQIRIVVVGQTDTWILGRHLGSNWGQVRITHFRNSLNNTNEFNNGIDDNINSKRQES